METNHLISQTAPSSGITIPPAQLWLGPKIQLQAEAERSVQQLFCAVNESEEHSNSAGPCNICVPCRQIAQHQFHALSWWAPEKQYSVDDIDELLARLRFANDPGARFFFVLEHADALPPACANRLLKSIEEPPAGYHFILLAQRKDAVLPTIQSRCIVRSWYNDEELGECATFIAEFTTKTEASPIAFLAALDAAELNEHNSLRILDAIMHYWSGEFTSGNSRAELILNQLHHAYTVPPMPGSAKLFWKNLYLRMSSLK